MPMSRPDRDDTLERAMSRLTEEVERFNRHAFVQRQNSLKALLFFQFLRGLAFGLGSVLGATVLVSVVALMLRQVEVVPILGEYARQIIDEIQTEP